jgi:hypothetical protein
MQSQTIARLVQMAMMAAILSACNLGAAPVPTQDIGVIQTQAVGLVATQFSMLQTQTAVAASPTPLPSFTPLPTVTPAAASTAFVFNTPAAGFTPLASAAPTQVADPCLQSAFVADVAIPDGTEMKPGEDFMKIWQIQNTGTCMWDDGYVLKYVGGRMDGYNVPIDQTHEFVKPGGIREFKVDLTAPLEEGHYEDCWKMQDDGGHYFGTYLCVKIVVD